MADQTLNSEAGAAPEELVKDQASPSRPGKAHRTEPAFGYPRQFLDNRFVYTLISPRARGLSIGVNMNPDKACNFDCVYCDVDRSTPARAASVDVPLMSAELLRTVRRAYEGTLSEEPCYRLVPEPLMRLREVALSGEGEPTLCPNFAEIVQAVVHIRAQAHLPFFKLILITNGAGLHQPQVREGLNWFTSRDEIWVKLEVGTPAQLNKINRAQVTLSRILANTLKLGRQRPIVIQSLFPLLHGEAPTESEINQYAKRLLELKNKGAQISLVQIYSAHRPTSHPNCGHLSLRALSQIAHTVRTVTGLKAEVY